MNTLIPWIALLIAGTALVAALVPSTPPPATPATVPMTTAATPGERESIARLQTEIATLRSELAALRDRPAVVAPAGGEPLATGPDEARVRALIDEALRTQRQAMPGGTPWGQPTVSVDPAVVRTQLAERFALEPAQADSLIQAATEMQTAMRTAFTPGGDREQAMTTIRTARETFDAAVAAVIPEDKREDFRRFASEQMGVRGGRGPRGERGDRERGPRDAAPAIAPAPPGLQEF